MNFARRGITMRQEIKAALKPFIPQALLKLRWNLLEFWAAKVRTAPLALLQYAPHPRYSYQARKVLVERIMKADQGLQCLHTPAEITAVVRAILAVPSTTPGVIVEAGCFKGGSTAKLSIAATMAGRKLLVFDSCEGLPPVLPEECAYLATGAFASPLEEVRANV